MATMTAIAQSGASTGYCGCCGAVAGGVAGGPSVGGEAGRRYHTM